LLHVMHLRVVEPGQGPHLSRCEAAVVEQHGGRNQGPGKAPPPRLVGTGDEPAAELAVESEQPAGRAPAATGPRLGVRR
jgi:hypothetical protein